MKIAAAPWRSNLGSEITDGSRRLVRNADGSAR
jgi:hypothetical protein